MEMTVLDRRHFHVGVLEDHSNSGIVTTEHPTYRNSAGAIAHSDFRADHEKLHDSLDARFRTGRTINVDRLQAFRIIHYAHQSRQSAGMVAMRMGNENIPDIAEVRSKPRQTTGNPVTRIDEILGTIYDQQVR